MWKTDSRLTLPNALYVFMDSKAAFVLYTKKSGLVLTLPRSQIRNYYKLLILPLYYNYKFKKKTFFGEAIAVEALAWWGVKKYFKNCINRLIKLVSC